MGRQSSKWGGQGKESPLWYACLLLCVRPVNAILHYRMHPGKWSTTKPPQASCERNPMLIAKYLKKFQPKLLKDITTLTNTTQASSWHTELCGNAQIPTDWYHAAQAACFHLGAQELVSGRMTDSSLVQWEQFSSCDNLQTVCKVPLRLNQYISMHIINAAKPSACC